MGFFTTVYPEVASLNSKLIDPVIVVLCLHVCHFRRVVRLEPRAVGKARNTW